jgi:hypothetical protein
MPPDYSFFTVGSYSASNPAPHPSQNQGTKLNVFKAITEMKTKPKPKNVATLLRICSRFVVIKSLIFRVVADGADFQTSYAFSTCLASQQELVTRRIFMVLGSLKRGLC